MTLRTGQVARLAGVNIQTLRYYERLGLLPQPVRSPGGHRAYSPRDVTLIRTIKSAQRLGFTLDEIAALLPAERRRAGDAGRSGLHDRAIAKLAEIDTRIEDLVLVRTKLAAVVTAGCDDLTSCTSPHCPQADLASTD